MPKFSYQAINEAGGTVTGELEAESADAARARLSTMGYIPVRVSAGGGPGGGAGATGESTSAVSSLFLPRVKAQELILFTKQFKTMLAAGLSILELLKILEQQSENKRLKMICAQMADDVKKGAPISAALSRHKGVFNDLYVSMAKAGEAAGALPEVLDRLIYIIDHENKVKSDIKSALQYPATVVIALIGAFFFLLTFVIPVFKEMFEKSKLDLPLPTKIAVGLNVFLTQYWYLLVGGAALVIFGLWAWFRTENGKIARDAFFLHIPVLGSLFAKAAMSRFASIFAILHASGVAVLQSLDILAETIGNMAIAHEFRKIQEQVKAGRGISGPLSKAKYFTPMVVTMVAVGEESGNLDEMLKAVSEHYDAEVAFSVKRLSDALGPLLIVGLAGVVGFFALAIFMPMWAMTKMAGR